MLMSKATGKLVAGLLALIFYVPSASADLVVVFDNGLPNTDNGFYILGTDETRDDFTIADGATITHVTFYFQNYNGITDWNQDITYNFWDARTGGNLLATGPGLNVTPVDSGLPWCCGGGNAWKVDFDLQTPFDASAGATYWLGLTGATGGSDAWWVTADTSNGMSSSLGNLLNNDFAFALSGGDLAPSEPVPVDSSLALTLLLLLIGATGIYAVRRHHLINT